MGITVKSNKTIYRIIISLSTLFLFVCLFFVVFQNKSQAVGPPGCSTEEPYNCAMNRRTFDQLVSQWCGLANADKQTECRLTFFSFVHHSPSAVRANARFEIPAYCSLNFPRDDTQNANLPDFCYVIAKRQDREGTYYRATKDIIEQCGLPNDQDRACVLRIQQQFLHDFNNDWADAPAPVRDSTSTSDAIDIDNEAGKTSFFERVASYIKWISLGLGIAAVFGLVISGIQYAAAQDNPQAVSGAKTRIYNIVIGIVIYVFMFGLLQWLIPGGIFKL